MNLILNFDTVIEAFEYSFANNTWLYPIYYAVSDLFASLFPIGSTIYSLMYMVTHTRNMMERALDSYRESVKNVVSPGELHRCLTSEEKNERARSRKDSFQEMLEYEESLVEVTYSSDEDMCILKEKDSNNIYTIKQSNSILYGTKLKPSNDKFKNSAEKPIENLRSDSVVTRYGKLYASKRALSSIGIPQYNGEYNFKQIDRSASSVTVNSGFSSSDSNQ